MREEKLNYFSAVKFLFPYIKNYKSNFIMFYCGWFFDMIAGVVTPVIFGVMIDQIVYTANINVFLRLSVVYIILSIFNCLLYFFIYAQHQYLMSQYVFNIQKDLFDHIHRCDATFLSGCDTGDIITTIQNYCRECMHFVIRNMIHILNSFLALAIYTFYIFRIDFQVGLVVLAAATASVAINTFFGKKIRAYSLRHKEVYGSHISYMFEIFGGITDLRLLGAQQKVFRKVKDQLKEIYAIKVRSSIAVLNTKNLVQFSNLAIQLLIFSFAGYSVVKGNMTIGLFTVLLTFYTQITKKIDNFTQSFLDAQERVGYIQKIYDYKNAPVEPEEGREKNLEITEGKVVFSHITFAYENAPQILENFTMTVEPGSRTALCGHSGCGKTTLGYMLADFYKPDSGKITIDNQDLRTCSLASIREQIGVVSQDVLIFDGSIKYNVLLGKLDGEDWEVENALRLAGIWDFVETLEHGMDTVIGPTGVNLSGGQRQRLAIARIYLKNPRIILFDEATSALDEETESKILRQWDDLLKGRTTIIIAHRLSSVLLCDYCVLIKDSKTIETGSPQQMVKDNDFFRKLFHVEEGFNA